MARIPYRGKDHNLISVGPSKAYDFTTVQGALDDIENSPPNGAPSSTNPYLVTVAPGVYAENVVITEQHNYCTLRGESKWASIIRPASGIGVLVNGVSSEAKFIAIENISINGPDGSGALILGADASPSSGLEWDEIDISDCVLDAQELPISVSGVTDGSSDAPPLLRVSRNLLRGTEQGSVFAGNMRLTSTANIYRCNAAGDSTWLATLTGTANSKVAVRLTEDGGSPKSTARLTFTGDVLETIGSQDVGGGIPLRRLCGVFAQRAGRTTLTGCRIYVENSDASATITSDRFAGVSAAAAIAEDDLLIAGGSIEVRQTSGANAAPDIYGIGSTGTTSFVKAYGTSIVIEDDTATSSVYSLFADSGCTIEAKVYSDTATGGLGTLTAITEKP